MLVRRVSHAESCYYLDQVGQSTRKEGEAATIIFSPYRKLQE